MWGVHGRTQQQSEEWFSRPRTAERRPTPVATRADGPSVRSTTGQQGWQTEQWQQQPQVLARQGPWLELTPQDVSAVPFELVSADSFPIGGRLRNFIRFWRRVTPDPSVLKTVLGVEVPFTASPVQTRQPLQYQFNEHNTNGVRCKLAWMLEQDIMRPVAVQPDQFVSPLFLATNSDLTNRPILNVSEINAEYLPKLHFKIETLAVVLPLINRGDWFTSWDLRKGFFNIHIHPAYQQYFCFDFEGQRYQFTCLVMGISISPKFFSKLVGVLVQLAGRWGIKISYHMDDTLLRDAVFSQAMTNITQLVGNLFQLAGFLLHKDKNVTTPTQHFKYLGFIIDSVEM